MCIYFFNEVCMIPCKKKEKRDVNKKKKKKVFNVSVVSENDSIETIVFFFQSNTYNIFIRSSKLIIPSLSESAMSMSSSISSTVGLSGRR